MFRRILMIAACGCALLAPPGRAQQPATGPHATLTGHWRMVYMDAATCAYGNITIKPPSPIGRIDALVNVSCGGTESVYTFAVLAVGRDHFIFQGISTSGPAGIGPNRLKYEFDYNKFDCTLAGRWFVDAPIGRLVLRKIDHCVPPPAGAITPSEPDPPAR